MQIRLHALVASTCLMMSATASANISIYPSKGLFGLDQTCRENIQTIQANGSAIECDFVKAAQSEAVRQKVQEIFVQELTHAFGGQVIGHVTQNVKHKTYIASLEVIRASEYVVNKASTSEVFLPVTLSLKLTNILTGEVIYSDSQTLSQPIKVLTESLESDETQRQIYTQYQSSLLTLTQKISQDLKTKFKLSEVQVEVVDTWKSYLILDKGFKHGIAKGDELSSVAGGLIRVVHADADYAVALPVLESKDKTYTKFSTHTAQAVNKPKAIVLDILHYKDESKDLVEQIFADAVGDQASFTLTPVNHRYSTLAQTVGEETDLAQAEDINQRELPEFFIRINVLPTIAYQQQIGDITQQQILHTEVMGEMIDRSGKIIYSTISTDDIKDIVSDGMGFSLEARKEISLKNALIQLGDKFKKEINFTQSDLKVKKVSNKEISIDDAGEKLSEGMKINIFNAQKVAGKNVLIPIWEATVTSRQGGVVNAQLDFPLSAQANVSVGSDDRILIDSHARSGETKFARVFCPNLHTEQIGEIPFYGFGPLTYHAFSAHSKYPLYATGAGFKGQISLKDAVVRMTENAGFKKAMVTNFHIPQAECLQPVFKIEVKEDSVSCDKNKSNCDVTLFMTSGARKFNAKGERIGAYGLQQDIALKGIDLAHREAMYNIQMLNALPSILKQIVQKADNSN